MIQALAGIAGGVSALKRIATKPIDHQGKSEAFHIAFAKAARSHGNVSRQNAVVRGVISPGRILPPSSVNFSSTTFSATTLASTNANAGNGTSLVLTPGLPAVTPTTGGSGSPSSGTGGNGTTSGGTPVTTGTTTSGGSSHPAVDQSALDILSAALRAAGIDPAGLNLVQHSDVVGYPGGSYTDNEITMTTAQGVHSFNVELVLQNPNVAVTEIGHFLHG